MHECSCLFKSISVAHGVVLNSMDPYMDKISPPLVILLKGKDQKCLNDK